jgi:hypothetical protein
LRLTNRLQLPPPIVAAITNDSYDPGDGDISITSLINSPRIVTLTQQHKDEIEEDAIDRIWSLLGQSIHEILRRANVNGIVEKRLYTELGGWRISGQFDRVEYFADNGLLMDFKVTSAWTAKGAGRKEWTSQLNSYAMLCNKNGYNIKHLEIVAILRDWRKNEAKNYDDYPDHQVKIFPIELWPMEKTEEFLLERIKMHQDARINLPLCTDEDRWIQGEKWAVMKKGRKRAIKLHDFELMASMQAKQDDSLYVEHRPGRYPRCEDGYCPVADFCTQWQEEKRIKILAGVKNEATNSI